MCQVDWGQGDWYWLLTQVGVKWCKQLEWHMGGGGGDTTIMLIGSECGRWLVLILSVKGPHCVTACAVLARLCKIYSQVKRDKNEMQLWHKLGKIYSQVEQDKNEMQLWHKLGKIYSQVEQDKNQTQLWHKNGVSLVKKDRSWCFFSCENNVSLWWSVLSCLKAAQNTANHAGPLLTQTGLLLFLIACVWVFFLVFFFLGGGGGGGKL